MSSASTIFGTKAYVCARYFLRPGKCFKYIDQRGEDATEHIYEVMALYPYCVLLRDARNGVRTCPGYNTLSLMMRGSETYEGLCELADCLDCNEILITEEHYDCESKSRPDWCPLMDLPEKDNGDYPANTFDSGFVEGWNQCIDEITGGGVDD